MHLRPFQAAAVEATLAAIRRGEKAGLITLPTGCGKTVTAAAIAGRLRVRTLFLVHREELLEQTVATFQRVFPRCPVGRVIGPVDEWQATADGRRPSVVVASVQSLHARRRRKMPRDLFSLVIVDEAHHGAARTWRAVLDHFSARFTLGLSATPERADGKGLADIFGREPLYSYGIRQAITDGFLARPRQYLVETGASLQGVAWRRGDFAEGELAQAVNTDARNRVVLEAYQSHAEGRRAIAFCAGVDHAEALAASFRDAGIAAAAVTGSMAKADRRCVLRDFAADAIRVVTNCAVLTEGFDDPAIEAVLMARPTGSRGLYTQCIGRGLRIAEGKSDCLILDFADNATKHKLATVFDLLGAPQATDASGRDVLEVAAEDVVAFEVEQRAAVLRPLSWRLKSVCPWPELPSLDGYTPTLPWHAAPATKRQRQTLRRFGFDVGRDLTKGEAAHLLDRAFALEAENPLPATSRQRWRLKQLGAWEEGMTKREASVRLGLLCKPAPTGCGNTLYG